MMEAAIESFRDEARTLVHVLRGAAPDLRAHELAFALREPAQTRWEDDRCDPAALLDGVPDDLRPAWAREIGALATLFRSAASPPAVHAFFGPVREHRCPKLHVDAYAARLVCTFAGPATEWVRADAVRWEALGRGDHACVDAANAAIAGGAPLEAAGEGDALLMKGAAWPGLDGRGAVHRSPPVGPGQARLVLILTSVERTQADACSEVPCPAREFPSPS